MAQVKFYKVTQDQYNGADKNAAGLYFTSDNGGLYAGSNIVAPTVFTATDEATAPAVTELSSLTITPNKAPKQGDVLIVTQEIVEGKNKQTAYSYNNGWVACDGNVCASNVILTENITMAGNYTQVGNLTKASNSATATFATSGKSVADAFVEIFSKELQPASPTQPVVTLTLSKENQSIEVGGTPANDITFTASLSAGSYTYGPATGITAKTWSVTNAAEGDTEKSSGSVATGFVKVVDTTVQSKTVTATATYDAGAVAKSNLGNPSNPTVQIAAGSKSASKPTKVTPYQNIFYGSKTSALDFTSTEEGVATVTVNNNIRALSKSTSLSSMNVVQGANQVIIAIPASKTLKKVTDGGALNAEITGNFIPTTMKVGGADSTATAVGTQMDYKVYVMSPSAPLDARTYTITIG